MSEQENKAVQGFSIKEDGVELWLRPDGVLLKASKGSVPFRKQYTWNEKEYAARSYIQGTSLSIFISQTRVQLSMLVQIMQKAMIGLENLHEEGIVHGRVHAGNIILCAHDTQPIWVDHNNIGSTQEDWNDFWEIFFSIEMLLDVGVEFFCAQLRHEPNKRKLLQEWSLDAPCSMWDLRSIFERICADVPLPQREDPKKTSLEDKIWVLDEEEASAWVQWIEQGKKGKELAHIFLQRFPARNPQGLLARVCEGIILGRLDPDTIQQYEKIFGLGTDKSREEQFAEAAVNAAKMVCDIEKEIEELEALSWYERSFGDTKEKLIKARERFYQALQDREEHLPKLIPRTRGLLDHDAAYRIAKKKQEKMIAATQNMHEWQSWFPDKVYLPQPPHPLGREKRKLEIEGNIVRFCRMPQGFWNDSPMNSSMWISECLVTQVLYTAVTGNQSSWVQGNDIPAHMIEIGDALHFCNRISEYFSLPAPYLFSGGAWSCISTEGFRLLTVEEWLYAASSSGIPSSEDILRQAWCSENSKGKIPSVRQREPNDWGLFDIFGGMEEWVWPPDSSHSCRVGGSWYHDRKAASMLKPKNGDWTLKSDTIGFRIMISKMIKKSVKGVSLG